MLDKTSEIVFNENTIQLPDSGMQLTRGTLTINNNVTLNGEDSEEKSFEWGNGNEEDDLDVQIMAGAYLNNSGYIYLNNSN